MTTTDPDQTNEEIKSPVSLPLIITVGDLAETLSESQVDVIKALMKLGVMASVNQEVDFRTLGIEWNGTIGFDSRHLSLGQSVSLNLF